MTKNIKQKNIENYEINKSLSVSMGVKDQRGYAILFTVIIVSAISVITAGLSNTAYKQLILSSLAKDSQAAFYQSDTATDCALYADQVDFENPVFKDGGTWSCGESSLNVTPLVAGGYKIEPQNQTSKNPCFRISVNKSVVAVDDGSGNTETKTEISAKGYNICDKNNTRTVEREIQINY